MGIKCIRSEEFSEKDPIFLYQNMVKTITTTSISKDYQFLQKIGRGSYSQVFRAKSVHTGNIRAIKKIQRKNQKIQQALINQFSILKQMDHPNILKMYQLYEQPRYYYITTQLCLGKELFQVIISLKFLKETNAKQIIYNIISAVSYLHENHIMHRDLKPQNIMYDLQTKTLKIVDFGSAIRFQNSQLIERKRIGTSYYIAPDVLDRMYNQKCDIWSLGIILYILLSGQPPFKGKQDEEILQNVQKGNLQFQKPIWKIISQQAKKLIQQMLQRDPKKRPSAQQVLKNQWFSDMTIEPKINNNDLKILAECLQNMKKFKDLKSSPIQEGILVFIVNFVRNSKDQTELIKCFKALDLNSDGVLSLQELKYGLSKYLKIGQKQSAQIAKKIFAKVDSNNSGSIDYSEFLIAASNLQLTVSLQNLDLAFNYLDQDGNGSLSVKEIRKRLGQNVSIQKYQELLKKFDKNSDGNISKEEFRQMMTSFLKM